MTVILIHKKSYYTLLIAILALFSQLCISQNTINEFSNFECSHSKLINIPFSQSTNTNNKSPVVINQTIFYEHRDQFSYWYKVSIHEDKLIDCKISALNDNDSYVLYIYKYTKGDFCNKVFYGKIKPLKGSCFLNNKDKKEAFELSQVQFKAKKNEAYYFCVLNTSSANCGHSMNLIAGIDTFNIKAIHYPCSDKEEEVKSKPKNEQKNIEVGVSVNQAKVLQIIELSVKEENNKNKKVDAKIQIKDELTGNEMKVESTGQNTYKLEIEKGKSYKVQCAAMGYKQFDHPVIISEYVRLDSNNFDIFLRPLKTGDNFAMDNIYFFPNTYALKKESEKEINFLLNYMINNPDVKIRLQGHTNGNNRIGKMRAYKGKGPEWNFSGSSKKLSRYRAEVIKKQLVSKGIDAEKISTQGFGGDQMIIQNAKTMDEMQKNVRVEVLIL